MRIVADTNTVLSGILWRGAPRLLLEHVRERTVISCTSLILLAELAEVIGRDKFLKRVAAAGLSTVQLVQDYERLAELVETEPLPSPVSRDPDDDHVLACALAAKADFVVSGDRDLLDVGEYRGIRILAVAEVLRRVKKR